MRKYDFYLIHDSFARFYYRREYFFYNLFKQYKTTDNPRLLQTLSKQIEFITKGIPVLKIQQQLLKQLQKRKDVNVKNSIFYVDNDSGSASFHIHNKKCILKASGSIDLDMIFMEALRKSDFNFFAIDTDNGRFGWVKPIKAVKTGKKAVTAGHLSNQSGHIAGRK